MPCSNMALKINWINHDDITVFLFITEDFTSEVFSGVVLVILVKFTLHSAETWRKMVNTEINNNNNNMVNSVMRAGLGEGCHLWATV